jgi:SpoVK/Ycf46/Vps4 family AAA+-type ATPase
MSKRASRSRHDKTEIDAEGYTPELRALVHDLASPLASHVLRNASEVTMRYKQSRYAELASRAQAAVQREIAIINRKIPELRARSGATATDAWPIFESVSRKYLEVCDELTAMQVLCADAETRWQEARRAPDAVFAERSTALVGALENLKLYSTQAHIVNAVVRVVSQFLRMPQSLNRKFLNFVLAGASGTGKTSMVHAIADVFSKCGMFVYDRVRIAGRAELVGEYEGQTVARTRAFLTASLECVVFIDEAYSITKWDDGRPESYGAEATTAMVEFMSQYKGLYSLFFAGYEKEIRRYFLPTNPGLVRRIPYLYVMSNLTTDGLMLVFERAVLGTLGTSDAATDGQSHAVIRKVFTEDACAWLETLLRCAHQGTWERTDGGEYDQATRTHHPSEWRFVPVYPKLYALFENQAGSMVNLAEEAVTHITNALSFAARGTATDAGPSEGLMPQDRAVMQAIVAMRIRNTAMRDTDDVMLEFERLPTLAGRVRAVSAKRRL